MTRIHDLLLREGFEGSYDAVRPYAARWTTERRKDAGDGAGAFIPMMFKPGEACQFDWSHEDVEIAGKPMRAPATISCEISVQRHEIIAAMGGLGLKGMATHPTRKARGDPGGRVRRGGHHRPAV